MTHRNGYRAREWQTRAGTLELQIPKLRRGSYFPSFLEPRRRSEQALLAVIQQCYVGGVSTRRVDQLVESLGLRVSKSEVSRICQALDEHVDAFRTRPTIVPVFCACTAPAPSVSSAQTAVRARSTGDQRLPSRSP